MTLIIKRELKILDFDLENRPLSYWYSGKTTAEITAISSCWVDDKDTIETWLLGIHEPQEILSQFMKRYNQADMVTGHYIRKHDLPIINGALMEYGLPILEPKLTQDTRIDFVRKGDLPATQEYLCELFGIPAPKVHMSQHRWRQSNRLIPEGIEATYKRASGDVLQHMLLRKKLVELNLLRAPKVWDP